MFPRPLLFRLLFEEFSNREFRETLEFKGGNGFNVITEILRSLSTIKIKAFLSFPFINLMKSKQSFV